MSRNESLWFARAVRVCVALCLLCVPSTKANADIMGGFVGPAPAPIFVPPGGAMFFGPPAGSVPLTTTISTTPAPTGAGIPLPPPTFLSPAVDVLFLTDTTGSMSLLGNGGIEKFKTAVAGGGGLLTFLESSFPSISFNWAVADYHDVIGDGAYVTPQYAVQATFGTAAAAEAAIALYDSSPPITTGGGLPGQEPEQQYSSLVGLTSIWDSALGGRALGEAERVIIWTGDSAANEGGIFYPGPPAVIGIYPTTFATFSALREQSIAVYGLNMGPPSGGIDSPGSLGFEQASKIAEATGGVIHHGQASASAPAMATDLVASVTSAITEMNNITVRVDPSTLGLWNIDSLERTTLFPGDPFYPFNFTYPSALPAGDPTNPFGFARPWGTDPLGGYTDTWGFTAFAPAIPDTQVVTFEVRVDGVLIDTVAVTLTNLPEPSTWAMGVLGAVSLLGYGWRQRRRRCGK